MKKKTKQGICPKCGSEDLCYGDTELEGESMGYKFTCNDCENDFIEWYNLEYSETLED
jgi:DNA-directed RNA polymerase subunit M/transcription elongation factor TFIIS